MAAPKALRAADTGQDFIAFMRSIVRVAQGTRRWRMAVEGVELLGSTSLTSQNFTASTEVFLGCASAPYSPRNMFE